MTDAVRCEACGLVDAVIEQGHDDAASPYLLCWPCDHRLQRRTLRPREWFHLAARYGNWCYSLRDDFYEPEDGKATQPDGPVVGARKLALPPFKDLAGSAESLFGYNASRYGVCDDASLRAWKRLDEDEVLEVLERRFDTAPNKGIRDLALVIAADVLGQHAARFVERVWKNASGLVSLQDLARASARCLDPDDGWQRVASRLETMTERQLVDGLPALFPFGLERSLDWIEDHQPAQVTAPWGGLAACSRLDAARTIAWLERGRPLSLIALDALEAILPSKHGNQRRARPKLVGPPEPEAMRKALRAYAKRDDALRVERLIPHILDRVDQLW